MAALASSTSTRSRSSVYLASPIGRNACLPDDLRALTPPIYAHVTPYGTFRIDMSKRLAIDQDAVAA